MKFGLEKSNGAETTKKSSQFTDTRSLQGEEREKFILANMPLVRYVAFDIVKNKSELVEVNDIIQVGILGLMDAMDKYDSTKGASFETFANYRIRGSIQDYLRRHNSYSRSITANTRHISWLLEQNNQRESQGLQPWTDEEMAAQLDMNIEKYREYLSLATKNRNAELLQKHIKNNGDVVDTASEGQDTLAHKKELKSITLAAFEKFLSTVKSPARRQRFRDVYNQHYVQERTFPEIAKGYNLAADGSRISQILTTLRKGISSELAKKGIRPEDIEW